jgi:hypothetical protein
MNIDKIVEELSTDKRYSHAVFGCFIEPGHYVQEENGNFPNLYKYASSEHEYSELFEKESSGQEFLARVHGEKIPKGYKLKLIFNDRKGDKRGSSHTDYMLLLPETESEKIILCVKSNPSIMIDLFREMFPKYDRSNGKLTMHSVKPQRIK